MGCCFSQEATLLRSAVDSEGTGPGPGPGPGPNMGPYGPRWGWGGGGMSHYQLFAHCLHTICSLIARYLPTCTLFLHYSLTICSLLAPYSPTIRHLLANYLPTIVIFVYSSTICPLFMKCLTNMQWIVNLSFKCEMNCQPATCHLVWSELSTCDCKCEMKCQLAIFNVKWNVNLLFSV